MVRGDAEQHTHLEAAGDIVQHAINALVACDSETPNLSATSKKEMGRGSARRNSYTRT